jgi:hypothetical protein
MAEDSDDDVDYCGVFNGTGPSYGRPFLERLLLSLIDAHPRRPVHGPEYMLHDREARLSRALEALFNEKPSQKLLDDAALFWMANEYVRDQVQSSDEWKAQAKQAPHPEGSVLARPRSERQLAQKRPRSSTPK